MGRGGAGRPEVVLQGLPQGRGGDVHHGGHFAPPATRLKDTWGHTHQPGVPGARRRSGTHPSMPLNV
ncbi:hypothetical protein E2C01_079751 [Portunus trituberculatus]|uniref:Uncharacterized protein n=1 Tax=Portunus trituberculatus TaxID=210409 RepID=A0A5B7IXU3_PORTR|nr:hypothetical protein [Portunus trituberculatus]